MSVQTKANLKFLLKEAIDLGNGQQFHDAFRKISNRLQRDPLEFGEALYHLPALHLQVFHAVCQRLSVDYAVHAERRLVFIRGFKYLP
jgi:hypothetical protein